MFFARVMIVAMLLLAGYQAIIKGEVDNAIFSMCIAIFLLVAAVGASRG